MKRKGVRKRTIKNSEQAIGNGEQKKGKTFAWLTIKAVSSYEVPFKGFNVLCKAALNDSKVVSHSETMMAFRAF